ncbi:hypothetical protein EDD86DRAFT_244763 [Gorgonomyces haynaldii]|nr:hypothetical protein EDD86DRAFT_244763 [Gorgonomyces haynaldii]
MAKKKKERDFEKKKLKVGKKQVASNHTVVDFKSQQIRVPVQTTLNLDKFEDRKSKLLLSLTQLTSHNSQTQMDACQTLAQLLNLGEDLFLMNMSETILGLAKALLNDNHQLRKSVMQFLPKLFESIDDEQMMPFFNTLVVFVCSSLSHINEHIRLDAMRMLRLLCEHYPDLIRRYGQPLLPHFYQILTSNKKTKGMEANFNANSKLGLNKSRDELLESFLMLVQILHKEQPPSKQLEGVSLVWKTFYHHEPVDLKLFGLQETKTNVIKFSVKQGTKKEVQQTQQVDTNLLIPILIDFWIESSELALSNPVLEMTPHFKNCYLVLKIIDILWKEDFTLLSKHMLKDLTEMNLIYVRLVLEAQDPLIPKTLGYMTQLFENTLKHSHSEVHLEYCLKITKQMIKHADQPFVDSLLSLQSGSRNEAHAHSCFEMIASLVKSGDLRDVEEWLLLLPKQLYQLKSKNLEFSQSILDLLSFGLRTRLIQDPKLESVLLPCIATVLSQKTIYGPIANYPEHLQESMLNTLFYLPEWSPKLLKSLVTVAPKLPTSTVIHLVDLANQKSMDQGDLLSLQLSLLIQPQTIKELDIFGLIANDTHDSHWERQMKLLYHSRKPTQGQSLINYYTLFVLYTRNSQLNVDLCLKSLLALQHLYTHR